jgi:hypothetical protein
MTSLTPLMTTATSAANSCASEQGVDAARREAGARARKARRRGAHAEQRARQ